MSQLLGSLLQGLPLLLAGTALFVSSWIVIPAPNYFFLQLGVGAPELSPWLIGVSTITLLLPLWGAHHNWIKSLAVLCSLLALLLSTLPLLQFPSTERRAAFAMQEALGTNYLAQIPSQTQMRSQPLQLWDVFQGIKTGESRYIADIPFANPAGVPLQMDVYQPLALGIYPALVVLYGGAWQYGNPKLNPKFNQYMAARGYVVFAIDYRHAPEHRFPAQLEDVRAALNFIYHSAAQYNADVDRIALLGRSAGAHLAMLAAYQPDALPIQAVVNYYGPVDLAVGYADPPRPDPLKIQELLEAFLGGTPNQLLETYRLASPASYTTRPLPPTLLVYGSRDHVVKAKFGQRMTELLQRGGSKAIFIEIPWAEHAFDSVFRGVSNQLTLYYTERFLAWALSHQK